MKVQGVIQEHVTQSWQLTVIVLQTSRVPIVKKVSNVNDISNSVCTPNGPKVQNVGHQKVSDYY